MLVSSIGYFKPLTNMVNRDYVVNNQSSKVNLNEGFGHINNVAAQGDETMFTRFLDSCKVLFSNNKSDESRKYLSMIA
jgi:hypothetical protein